MSNPGSDTSSRNAQWDRLELAVRRLLDERAAAAQRFHDAERRVQELEKALDRFSGKGLDPMELSARVEELAAENGKLRSRLERAQEHVQRIMQRLHFLEGAQ